MCNKPLKNRALFNRDVNHVTNKIQEAAPGRLKIIRSLPDDIPEQSQGVCRKDMDTIDAMKVNKKRANGGVMQPCQDSNRDRELHYQIGQRLYVQLQM